MRERKFVADNSKLVAEWHPEKNLPSTPETVSFGTRKKFWWICSKGHEFEQAVLGRSYGQGCPYCGRKRVGLDNTLADVRPDIAARWHPTMNGDITPKDIGAGNKGKFWFVCPEGHEYEAAPRDLSKPKSGTGCGFCHGRRVNETNSIAGKYPHLAAEWHPTKNGDLRPESLTGGSMAKIWWKCSRGHEWKTTVNSRTSMGSNCPSCRDSTSRWELLIFCEMKMIFGNVTRRDKSLGVEVDVLLHDQKVAIEVDGAFWHEDREEQDRAKNDHLHASGYAVIRVRERGLNLLGELDVPAPSSEPSPLIVAHVLEKIRDHISITDTQRNQLSSYISKGVLCDEDGYREMVSRLPAPPYEESLAALRPDVIEMWDVEANLPLTPDMFREKSGHKVWWRCPSGHSWHAQIAKRSDGRGCPMCYGRKQRSVPPSPIGISMPYKGLPF